MCETEISMVANEIFLTRTLSLNILKKMINIKIVTLKTTYECSIKKKLNET